MTADPRLDDLFDHAPVGFVTTDQNWSITAVSRTLRDWLELPDDHGLEGQHLTTLLTAASRIYHETHYAPLVLRNGHVQEIAADMRREGRDPLPVLLGSLALPEGGPYTSIRTSVVRVVERRRYEEELLAQRRRAEASEQRTATLLAGISALVGAESVEDVSEALAAAGAAIPGVANATIWLVEPGGAALREHGRGAATARLLPATAEHPVTACARDRETIVDERLGMVAAPLCAGEVLLGVLLVAAPELVDMPDADQDLVSSLAAQAGIALERARAQQRRETIQRSAGRDVLVPLQTVLGHAMSLHDLLEERLSASERDALGRLIWNAERINRLVEGFLELTAVEDDLSRLQRRPLRLADVLDEAVQTVLPTANSRSVRVEVANMAAGVKVDGDEHLLGLALAHLVEDAILHSPRNGLVGVTLVTDDEQVTVSVRNDAGGDRLPQETWVQVTSDGEDQRLGLGLAVAEGLIGAHGGHVLLDEGPSGALVHASLPLHLPQSSAATTS